MTTKTLKETLAEKTGQLLETKVNFPKVSIAAIAIVFAAAATAWVWGDIADTVSSRWFVRQVSKQEVKVEEADRRSSAAEANANTILEQIPAHQDKIRENQRGVDRINHEISKSKSKEAALDRDRDRVIANSNTDVKPSELKRKLDKITLGGNANRP